MSFLTPLFLIGGLAIAGPIIFHLIRQTTRERKIFSSLMFLQPSPPKLTRRSRLEHLLLLALRCAVLLLLALGFARPFLKHAVANPDVSHGRRVVLLLDTSASMRREGLWAEAQKRVEKVIRDSSPLDQLSLMTFDRSTRTLLSFEQWNAAAASDRPGLALSRLKDTQPSWGGTHLGPALIAAAESLSDEPGKPMNGPRQIILFTDLQEGSRLDSLQGYEWPKDTHLSVEVVAPQRPSNAGLQLMGENEGSEGKDNGVVRVRVSNSSRAARDRFKVGWVASGVESFAMKPEEVYVPAGQSRMLPLQLPTNQSPTHIILQGDDEPFDNSVFIVPPETQRLNILYFGEENEKDATQPLYFLRQAFQETRREQVAVLSRSTKVPPISKEVEEAGLFVVTESLPAETARELRTQVEKGRIVLFLLRNEGGVNAFASLSGIERPDAVETRPKNYAMLGEIDFNHPLFAPFSDPKFNDFTKIHFWKYWRIDPAKIPGARIPARFDSHDPAVIELALGRGKVMALTSGWQPEDSQLALSTKFVPLLYACLDMSSPLRNPSTQYFVGDTLPIAADTTGEKVVRLPDGSTQKVSGTNFTNTPTPGVYEVTSSSGPVARFAVNLESSETRTEPMAVDQLESLGAPIQAPRTIVAVANAKVRLQNSEIEGRQKMWRWLLLAAAIFVLMETWLAGRATRKSPAIA